MDDVMLISEVAAFLRCSDKTVQRMVNSGELPALGKKGCVRILKSDVLNLFKKKEK